MSPLPADGCETFDPPFLVDEPAEHVFPFVFNAPHSGAHYPPAFLAASRLDALTLRRSEDAHVDRLFASVVGLGAPLMRACFPRAYLDLNREPYELDPRMFTGRLPSYANTRSMRVAGGLGTVPRIVADGQEIYRERLPVEEAVTRIETLYKPYHRTLRGLIQRTARTFGKAILIDCHSMPSSSLGRDESARRISCSAIASERAAVPVSPRAWRIVCGPWGTGWCATSPMPAASSPSITASPVSDGTRFRSRSIGRST